MQTQEGQDISGQSCLAQVKEVGAVIQKEINTECKILTYISLALTVFGLVMVAILQEIKIVQRMDVL